MVSAILQDLQYAGRMQEATLDRQRTVDMQVTYLVHRIGTLPRMSFEDALSVLNEIRGGPWPPDAVGKLETAVLQHSMQVGGQLGGARARRDTQHCEHFENYLTSREWETLRGATTRAAKIEQLAQRAWSIGLDCPTEQTAGRGNGRPM